MNEDDLRAMGPQGLTKDRHAALRASLMSDVTSERHPDQQDATTSRETLHTRRRTGPRRRSAMVALVAVGVVATTTAAAALNAALRPDPQDVATVIDLNSDVVESHVPGWRPDLAAESVDCSRNGRTEFDSRASDFPLGDALTTEDLVRACTGKNLDLSDESPQAATACRDENAAFPTPTIELDSASCADGTVPLTSDDLLELNEARSMEVSLLAFDDKCPTRGQVEAWVSERIAAQQIPLVLALPSEGNTTPTTVAGVDGSDPSCFGVYVSWPNGTVTVDTTSTPN